MPWSGLREVALAALATRPDLCPRCGSRARERGRELCHLCRVSDSPAPGPACESCALVPAHRCQLTTWSPGADERPVTLCRCCRWLVAVAERLS